MISSRVIRMRYLTLGGPTWPPNSVCPAALPSPAATRRLSQPTVPPAMPESEILTPTRSTMTRRSNHGRSEAETVAGQHARPPLAVEDHCPDPCRLPEPRMRRADSAAPGVHQLRAVPRPSDRRRLTIAVVPAADSPVPPDSGSTGPADTV